MLGRRCAIALSSLVVVSCVVFAPSAHAFCRATTCDRTKGTCPTDGHNCQVDGAPLSWTDGTFALGVDSAGSTLRAISADQFQKAVTDALETWVSAKCPSGGHPSLRVKIPALVDGAVAVYVPTGPNENVVLFHDDHWPHEHTALGKTALAYDIDTGKMLDADIELNSEDYVFSTDGGGGSDIDLQAVLTHEVGHVLGLDHSDAPGATMQPETTSGFGALALRTLAEDDMDGICLIYPPGASPPAAASDPNRGNVGLGGVGGCSVAMDGRRGGYWVGGAIWWLVFCMWDVRGRTRSKRAAP